MAIESSALAMMTTPVIQPFTETALPRSHKINEARTTHRPSPTLMRRRFLSSMPEPRRAGAPALPPELLPLARARPELVILGPANKLLTEANHGVEARRSDRAVRLGVVLGKRLGS